MHFTVSSLGGSMGLFSHHHSASRSNSGPSSSALLKQGQPSPSRPLLTLPHFSSIDTGSSVGAPTSIAGELLAFDATAVELNSLDTPSAPLLVDIWSTDLHEYALPFTRPPTAVAPHPLAPLYARGGPEGLVAVCSLTLEPMLLQETACRPADAEQHVSWHRYVHRIHTIYSYDSLDSIVDDETISPRERSGFSVASVSVGDPALPVKPSRRLHPGSSKQHPLAGGSSSPSPGGVLSADAASSSLSSTRNSDDERILRLRWAPDGSRVLGW